MTDNFDEWLAEAIRDADERAAESHAEAMNSYGAGYDRGYADALLAVQQELKERAA